MSKLLPHRFGAVALALCLVAALPLGATTLQQMNLDQLVDNAGNVADVTIVNMTTGTVSVGGTTLPTVTVQAKVNEPFKGDFTEVKGDLVLEITMVGTVKDTGIQVGDQRSFSALPQLPQLVVGGQYILMTTPPSAIGLSTTVGLGQGAFRVYEESKVEMVVNEFNNSGLFNGMGIQSNGGAITREELVAAIQAAVAN